MNPDVRIGGRAIPINESEPILQSEKRDISILVAHEDVTITRARYAAGQQVAGPHVHHQHTDAFYVIEGELTFEIGRERRTITVSPGGYVAVPPGVAHSFATNGDRPARWLTIHTPDGGFAGFMRGIRDGLNVEWDIAAVPAGGGLPASAATVTRPANRS
jgi:quercetin dioxygenase-like cupin family protein